MLRQQGDDPDWTPGSAFDLHRQRDDCCTCRWQLVQARYILKPVSVRAVQNLMDDKISGRAMINARGVNPHPVDFSLHDQKLGGLFGESGEVESFRIAGCHTAQILHLVWPISSPSGMHKNDGADRNSY